MLKKLVPESVGELANRTPPRIPKKALDTANRIVKTRQQIEALPVVEAGELGFMSRGMTLASLPHSEVQGVEFERFNGPWVLSIMSPREVGLPYGTLPRLLLAWISTEATRLQSRELVMGETLTEFMRKLDIVPTGGQWGTIGRLREQTERLFSSTIRTIYKTKKHFALRNHTPIDAADIWWDPHDPDNFGAWWQSTVRLGEKFFQEICEHPIPIDMRALNVLRKSPMALDIYVWLTYRMFYLQSSCTVSWEQLQDQFGAGYPADPQGLRNFRKAFLAALKKVRELYPDGKASHVNAGIRLTRGKPHVPSQLRLDNIE